MHQEVEAADLVGLRFAAGEENGLALAYEACGSLVYTIARRSTGNDADAADITQAVFMSAWQSRDSFDPGAGSLPAWLATITRRRVADHFRRRSVTSEIPTDAVPDEEPRVRRLPEEWMPTPLVWWTELSWQTSLTGWASRRRPSSDSRSSPTSASSRSLTACRCRWAL